MALRVVKKVRYGWDSYRFYLAALGILALAVVIFSDYLSAKAGVIKDFSLYRLVMGGSFFADFL